MQKRKALTGCTHMNEASTSRVPSLGRGYWMLDWYLAVPGACWAWGQHQQWKGR